MAGKVQLNITHIYFLNVQIVFNINCVHATIGSVMSLDVNGPKKFNNNFIPNDERKAPKLITNMNFRYLFALLSSLL